MSFQDKVIEIAVTAVRYYPVKKLAQTYAKFILHGTATPFTAVYEGKQGTGKTTFAIFTLLGVLALYAVHMFEPEVLHGVIRIQGFPPREKIEKYNPEFYSTCKALYEGDLDRVIEYLSKNVIFDPTHFIQRVKEIVKSSPTEARPVPGLVLDDAGIFFFRSMWQSGDRSWRRAVVYSMSLMQVLRSFTAGLIVTTPSRELLVTRLERLLEHAVFLSELDQADTLYIRIGDRVKIYTTNKYAKYFVRVTRYEGSRLVRRFIDITQQVSVKGAQHDPVFIVGREIIDEVLRDVWEVRQRWIAYVTGLVEKELRRIQEEVEEEEMLEIETE
jgi:hypothetical protein